MGRGGVDNEDAQMLSCGVGWKQPTQSLRDSNRWSGQGRNHQGWRYRVIVLHLSYIGRWEITLSARANNGAVQPECRLMDSCMHALSYKRLTSNIFPLKVRYTFVSKHSSAMNEFHVQRKRASNAIATREGEYRWLLVNLSG